MAQQTSGQLSSRKPQIILFGDSLFQHSSQQKDGTGFSYFAAIANEYIRRKDVINNGCSGYNTDQALEVMREVIPTTEQAKVSDLIVWYGANDACLPGTPGSQHVPIDRYKQNLRDIITADCVQAHKPRVLLVTPPPIDERTCEERDREKGINEPRRKASNTKLYADAAREVGEALKAQGYDVAMVDLYSNMLQYVGGDPLSMPLVGSREAEVNEKLQSLLHDGLHFNPKAYELLFQATKDTIRNTWPDQVVDDSFKYVVPAWNDEVAWRAWRLAHKS